MDEKLQKTVDHYCRIFFWPFFIAAVFESAAVFLENSLLLIWLANFCLFIYVLIRLKTAQEFTIQHAAWLGGIITCGLTLIWNLVQIITAFKFWYLFILITQPLIYAALGAGLMSFMYYLTKKILKGGETHGRKKGIEI